MRRFRRKKIRRIKDAEVKKVRIKPPLIKRIMSWIFQILIVISFAFIFTFYFCNIRNNLGQSMSPVLSSEDKVLVNTLAYKLGTPDRGDVIVFKPNGNTKSHSYIMRVVGLPGETIQIEGGQIYIDGEIYIEGKDYANMNDSGLAADEIVLGSDEYFVLGDNRNNSEDSRYADVGNVSLDDIEGKAWFVLSPFAHFGFVK